MGVGVPAEAAVGLVQRHVGLALQHVRGGQARDAAPDHCDPAACHRRYLPGCDRTRDELDRGVSWDSVRQARSDSRERVTSDRRMCGDATSRARRNRVRSMQEGAAAREGCAARPFDRKCRASDAGMLQVVCCGGHSLLRGDERIGHKRQLPLRARDRRALGRRTCSTAARPPPCWCTPPSASPRGLRPTAAIWSRCGRRGVRRTGPVADLRVDRADRPRGPHARCSSRRRWRAGPRLPVGRVWLDSRCGHRAHRGGAHRRPASRR